MGFFFISFYHLAHFISHYLLYPLKKSVYEIVPPKITPFTFGDEPMNQDEPVSISCTLSGGDLPINVSWTLNGAEIESWHEILTETRGKRINVLMIESLKAKHAGNYSCIAENAAGTVVHSSELIVNG